MICHIILLCSSAAPGPCDILAPILGKVFLGSLENNSSGHSNNNFYLKCNFTPNFWREAKCLSPAIPQNAFRMQWWETGLKHIYSHRQPSQPTDGQERMRDVSDRLCDGLGVSFQHRFENRCSFPDSHSQHTPLMRGC